MEKQIVYCSDAYKKYEEQFKIYRNKPWRLIEDYTGQKSKWYQKINMLIKYKIFDIKDYFTNPYKIMNRVIKKSIKK